MFYDVKIKTTDKKSFWFEKVSVVETSENEVKVIWWSYLSGEWITEIFNSCDIKLIKIRMIKNA